MDVHAQHMHECIIHVFVLYTVMQLYISINTLTFHITHAMVNNNGTMD